MLRSLPTALVFVAGSLLCVSRAAAQQQPAPADTTAGARRLTPVVVTATRDTLGLLDTPLPAAVLGRQELRREHGVSLARTVERASGVRALSTGQQIAKPVIRGLSGPRVLVLDGGNRLEDYSWSEEDGPSIDARQADRIEVIRGPASVLYGSDAIGGVVNAIPAPLPDARGRHPFTSGALELYGATNNAELGTALRLDGARGPLGGRLFLVGRRAEDLTTPAGKLDNTGFEALNGEGAVGVRGERGSIALRYVRYGGEFRLLEAGGRPTVEPVASGREEEGPERKVSDDRLQVSGDWRARGVTYEVKGQWERHQISELSDELGTPGDVAATEVTVFDLALDTYTIDLLAHAAPVARLRGTAGVSALYQRNDTRGPIPLVPDATSSGVAAFAFARYALHPALAVVAGARGDRHAIDARANATLGRGADSRDWSAGTGDVGLVYQPAEGLALTANVGRAWRAPTLFELFTNGPRLGEARYEVGAPDLLAEASLNADLGARWQRGMLRGELSAFRNRIDHFIYVTPTAEVLPGPDGEPLRVYRYEQARATLAGGEASLAVTPWEALTVGARYDLVRGRNEEAAEPLPLMPPPRLSFDAELRRERLPLGATAGALRAEVETVSAQRRLSSFDVPTAGYTLLHLGAGAEHSLFGRGVRLDVRVRNVSNARYRNFLNRYKEFALDAGRDVIVRASTGF